MKTLEITNFTGRLTRQNVGELNSGYANFFNSHGYDPFSKPGSLTWFEQPVNIDPSNTTIADLIVASKILPGSSVTTVFAVGNAGNLYTIQSAQPVGTTSGDVDTITNINSTDMSGADFSFGSSMEFLGSTIHIYVSTKGKIDTFTTAGVHVTAFTGGSIGNFYLPLKQFQGKVYFGNGNNIGEIDSSETLTTATKLSPSLPPNFRVKDLQTTPDGTYLLIIGDFNSYEGIGLNNDVDGLTNTSYVFYWNGIDQGYTSFKTLESTQITSIHPTPTNSVYFTQDFYGAAISVESSKKFSLPGAKSPRSNAVSLSSGFIMWASPEVRGNFRNYSLFYYGSLDGTNETGLWRVMRGGTTLSSGFIAEVPINTLTSNSYKTVNSLGTAIATQGYGKHYFSVLDANSSTTKKSMFKFYATPTGSGTAMPGLYQTQTQVFGQKITIKQIRVYTEPTVANNEFNLLLVDSNGNTITNGTFNYSYSAGSDTTKLQGALDRINFNPSVKDLYAFSVQILNAGSVNMTILKIEIDYEQSGK